VLDPPIVFPPVRPGDPVTISASLFVAFVRCPEQAAGRLRGEYPTETRQSFVGGLAHRIFARHLTRGPIAPEGFAAACREEIGVAMNHKLAALGVKPSELGRVIDEVSGLYERFRSLGAEGFVGAEVHLESEAAPDVTLRGSVDAVFEEGGGVRLVDWKTGALGDPEAQLGFYALLWALERHELPGHIEAVSVTSGERLEAVPTRQGVEATAARVAAVVDALRDAWEGTALERSAGPWCRWCPLLEGCSEGRSAASLLDG
jgi:hypothetical protein